MTELKFLTLVWAAHGVGDDGPTLRRKKVAGATEAAQTLVNHESSPWNALLFAADPISSPHSKCDELWAEYERITAGQHEANQRHEYERLKAIYDPEPTFPKFV